MFSYNFEEEFLEFLDELDTQEQNKRNLDENYFLWQINKAVFQEEMEDE